MENIKTKPRDPMPKQEAVDFFAALFYGEHHIHGEIKECGYGWQISSNYIQLSRYFDYKSQPLTIK